MRINRNIVECKEDFTVFQLQSGFCINRNIVECKGEFAIPHPKRACRINRNIVECKDGYFVFNESSGIVLIETLWNVKTLFGEE